MTLESWQIDALWLAIAFFSGLLASKLELPPLIGFLAAGFAINLSGFTEGHIHEVINELSDLGVMLLLFTIGLKIKIKNIFQKEIVTTAALHMLLTVLFFGLLILMLSYTGLSLFTDLKLESIFIIAFAMSFSSTVFVVKVLEEKGEFTSFHGALAIGILIIQDIFAVIYISASAVVLPSLWVLILPLYLFLIRKVIFKLLDKTNHGELLSIFGFFCTFVFGALSFQLVGLKPDLGALVIGMLMVDHPKSAELYDRMMGFKDFFLIAFFVNIGLMAEISWMLLFVSLLFLIPLSVKAFFFSAIFSRFNIRARTALLTSLSLTNYSEFGLIVMFSAISLGTLPPEWLTIMALMLSFSFIISAPINKNSHRIYDRWQSFFVKINGDKVCKDSEPVSFGDAQCLIIGMGSIGLPAYDYLSENSEMKVIGIDYSHDKIKELASQNYNVMWGDSTDSLFWRNAQFAPVKLLLLAISDLASTKNSLLEIRKFHPKRDFKVGVVYTYADERNELIELGADFVYSTRNNIGADFAHETVERYEKKLEGFL